MSLPLRAFLANVLLTVAGGLGLVGSFFLMGDPVDRPARPVAPAPNADRTGWLAVFLFLFALSAGCRLRGGLCEADGWGPRTGLALGGFAAAAGIVLASRAESAASAGALLLALAASFALCREEPFRGGRL